MEGHRRDLRPRVASRQYKGVHSPPRESCTRWRSTSGCWIPGCALIGSDCTCRSYQPGGHEHSSASRFPPRECQAGLCIACHGAGCAAVATDLAGPIFCTAQLPGPLAVSSSLGRISPKHSAQSGSTAAGGACAGRCTGAGEPPADDSGSYKIVGMGKSRLPGGVRTNKFRFRYWGISGRRHTGRRSSDYRRRWFPRDGQKGGGLDE
mmetsp:Transcript_33279/g.93337  ORF Transcript_33279/g.93337 Transcript_33279/m.93337 type:complete len:207 (-) Transcript_33279:824-1444(-)